MFLLDSDHVSIIQRHTGPEYKRILEHLLLRAPESCFISIITLHEQFAGWSAYLSRAKQEEDRIYGYAQMAKMLVGFQQSQLLMYESDAVEVFSDMRKKKIRVGSMDLRIAAIAIANQMTVVTRNSVDFERIPGLNIEDWTV